MRNLIVTLVSIGCIFLTACNGGSNSSANNQLDSIKDIAPQDKIKLSYKGSYKFNDMDIKAFRSIAISPNNELYAISYYPNPKFPKNFFINMFSIKDDGSLVLDNDYTLPRKDWISENINGMAFGNNSNKYMYLIAGKEISTWAESPDSQLYSIQNALQNQDTHGGIVVVGNFLYSATYDGYINWYSINDDGSLKYEAHLKNDDAQEGVAFSAKSKYIYSATDGGGAGGLFQYGYINWYSINNDGSLQYKAHLKNDDVPFAITSSRDGKYIYTVTQNRGWSGPLGHIEWYAVNDDGSLTRQGCLKTENLPSEITVSSDNRYLYARRGYSIDYYEIANDN